MIDPTVFAGGGSTRRDATAQVDQGPALGIGDGVERVVSIGVSGSWFHTLGVRPALGRAWDPEEVAAGRASRVVVLSDSLWRHAFGADPAIVGRTIPLDGVAPSAPGPYLVVAGLLLVIGLAACLEPALRATRTDPAGTLREA